MIKSCAHFNLANTCHRAILNGLPVGMNISTRSLSFLDTIYGLKGAVETFRKWCLVHSLLRVARQLGCPFFIGESHKYENMYFILFGWGEKRKTWKIADDKLLVATWSHFNLFWCPIAFNIKWHLIEKMEDEIKISAHILCGDYEIPYEKVKNIVPEQTPDIDIWQRYGLVLVIVGIALINIWNL